MNAFTKKKQTLRQKKQAMNRWFFGRTCRTFLVVSLFMFGFLYLLQTSTVSSKGYELSDLESRVQNLERDTQRLEVEIAAYRSMRSIQDRLENMDMVVADHVEYARTGGRVATR
jgi:hypothetical protein